MAEASLALSASLRGRNPASDAAALHHEWSAALSIWVSFPPGSRKREKVWHQLAELRGRLDAQGFAPEAVHG